MMSFQQQQQVSDGCGGFMESKLLGSCWGSGKGGGQENTGATFLAPTNSLPSKMFCVSVSYGDSRRDSLLVSICLVSLSSYHTTTVIRKSSIFFNIFHVKFKISLRLHINMHSAQKGILGFSKRFSLSLIYS